MNDDFYTATTSWTRIVANGAEITNGTFSIVSYSTNRVDLVKSNVLPVTNDGTAMMRRPNQSRKYDLAIGEFLYIKARDEPIQVGIVTA